MASDDELLKLASKANPLTPHSIGAAEKNIGFPAHDLVPAAVDDVYHPIVGPEYWSETPVIDTISGTINTEVEYYILNSLLHYHLENASRLPQSLPLMNVPTAQQGSSQPAGAELPSVEPVQSRYRVPEPTERPCAIEPTAPLAPPSRTTITDAALSLFDGYNPTTKAFWARALLERQPIRPVVLHRPEMLGVTLHALDSVSSSHILAVDLAAESDALLVAETDAGLVYQFPYPSLVPGQYLAFPGRFWSEGFWSRVWNAVGEAPGTRMGIKHIRRGIRKATPGGGETAWAECALVGVLLSHPETTCEQGVISPATRWESPLAQMWHSQGRGLDEPLPKQAFLDAIADRFDCPIEQQQRWLEWTVDRGRVYIEGTGDDQRFLFNHWRGRDGPDWQVPKIRANAPAKPVHWLIKQSSPAVRETLGEDAPLPEAAGCPAPGRREFTVRWGPPGSLSVDVFGSSYLVFPDSSEPERDQTPEQANITFDDDGNLSIGGTGSPGGTNAGEGGYGRERSEVGDRPDEFGLEVRKDDVFAAFKTLYRLKDLEEDPPTRSWLGRNLNSAFPELSSKEVESRRLRLGPGDDRHRCYSNVDLTYRGKLLVLHGAEHGVIDEVSVEEAEWLVERHRNALLDESNDQQVRHPI